MQYPNFVFILLYDINMHSDSKLANTFVIIIYSDKISSSFLIIGEAEYGENQMYLASFISSTSCS